MYAAVVLFCFLRFKTNVTESIGRILVHGVHLHTLSKYTYSHYKNCEDENYFLANDLVNDMTVRTVFSIPLSILPYFVRCMCRLQMNGGPHVSSAESIDSVSCTCRAHVPVYLCTYVQLIALSDAASSSGIGARAGNNGIGIGGSTSGMRGKEDLKLLTVLGCQDGYIRAISGSDLYYEAALQGAVTVLNNDYVYSSIGGAGGSGAASTSGVGGSGNELIYGLDNGTIGQMLLTGESIRRGWVVDGGSSGGTSADGAPVQNGSGTQKSQGSVKSILSKLDVTHDGVNDVVVGRDDGTMEVYGFNFNGDPELLYNRSVGETVHTIDGGFITSGETEEIIAQTYSGKVLCFHPNNTDYDMDLITSAQNEAKAAKKKEENEKVLESLGREVKDLEKAVKKEQERFSRISNTFLQPVASFHVKDKFHLNPGDGSYVLQLETTVAVAMLTLQSQISIEIEDVIADNSGSIQYSTATDASGTVNSHLMTYRASQPSKRIELKLWLREGKESKLQVFIIPDQKDTAGSVCTYNLMPLSLHKRMHNTIDRADRPLSELSLRGQFIIPEAHSWLAVCLPELPSTFNVDDDKIEYVFHCSSIDTLLECRVQAGNLSFRSDSIVTLMTVKNHLVADATTQHIKLNVHFNVHPDGLKHFCSLIWPQLSYQRTLKRKMCMVDGILEIKRQEDDLSFLSQDLHTVMNEADRIREDFSRQPRYAFSSHQHLSFFPNERIPRESLPHSHLTIAIHTGTTNVMHVTRTGCCNACGLSRWKPMSRGTS